MDIIWWMCVLGLFVDDISTQITIEVCPQPTPTVGICSSRLTRTRCTSNLQCRPGFLCCLQGCGRMCKPALTVRQHTRAGICPVPPPLTAVICPPRFKNLCRLDSDCIADFKCCYHPCGSKCVNPFQRNRVLETGSCPNPETLDGGPCPGSITDKCSSDSDCTSDLKCCEHPCGRMCLNPAISTRVLKSGSCPMPHDVMCYLPKRDRCSSDANCEGSNKCCSHPCGRNCVPPESLSPNVSRHLMAPSLWPAWTRPSRILNVVSEAILPVPFLKPGVCPIQRQFQRFRCYQKRDYCTTDASCRGSLKCCNKPCGKRCTRPEPEIIDTLPSKSCPPVDLFGNENCDTNNSPFRACRNDLDCPSTEQCCPGTCGSNCLPRPPICPNNPCGNLHIKCQFGQERDSNGCLLCKCRNPISKPNCPLEQIVYCFVDPCKFATCANPAAHQCISNYCGGCRAEFYDINGNEVTNC